MTKIEKVKNVVRLVTSIGVGIIINNAVKCTTPGPLGLISKICVGIGCFALGGLVSSKVTDYTDEVIDDGAIEIKKILDEAKI